MQTYLYFCNDCGGDTASYSMLAACPYCHAHRPSLRLVGKFDDSQAEGVQDTLQGLRQSWLEQHQSRALGERSGRRRLWSRGR